MHELESLAESKSRRTAELHGYLQKLREVSGAFLLLGLSFFLVGGISGNVPLAASGWVIWLVAAFVPAIVDGIDAILLDAIAARPLVFGRDGKVVYGDEARGIGMRRLIGGVGLLVVALLASSVVFAQ